MKKGNFRVILCVLLLCLGLAMPVFASGGGGGTGGGSGKPLEVESVSMDEGSTLPQDRLLVFTFNKNVNQADVREENRKLVRVINSADEEIEVEITMFDDQIEPERRNDIELLFPENLPNDNYVVVIEPGITSKSGDVLEEEYRFKFVVKEDQTEEASEPVTEAATEPATEEVTEPMTEPATEEATKSVTEATSDPAKEETDGGSGTILILLGVGALLLTAVIVLRR